MAILATEQITLTRVNDGEISQEDLAKIESAVETATNADVKATAADENATEAVNRVENLESAVDIQEDRIDIVKNGKVITSFGVSSGDTTEEVFSRGVTLQLQPRRISFTINPIHEFTSIEKIEMLVVYNDPISQIYEDVWVELTGSQYIVSLELIDGVINLETINVNTAWNTQLFRITGNTNPLAQMTASGMLRFTNIAVQGVLNAKSARAVDLEVLKKLYVNEDITTMGAVNAQNVVAKAVNSPVITCEGYIQTDKLYAFESADVAALGADSITINGHAQAIGYTSSGSGTTSLASGTTFGNLTYFTLSKGNWEIVVDVYGTLTSGKRFGICCGVSVDGGATIENYLNTRHIISTGASGAHSLQTTFLYSHNSDTARRVYLRAFHNNGSNVSFDWNYRLERRL